MHEPRFPCWICIPWIGFPARQFSIFCAPPISRDRNPQDHRQNAPGAMTEWIHRQKRNLPGRGRQRWRARSEHRKSTTTWGESRPGRNDRKEESRPTSQNSRRHGRGKREDAKGQEYLFHNLKSTIIGLWSEGCQKLLSFAGSRTGSLQSPVGIRAAVILEKSFGVQ